MTNITAEALLDCTFDDKVKDAVLNFLPSQSKAIL
jgi:hypothetical protein